MTEGEREHITGMLEWLGRTHEAYLPTPKAKQRQGEAFMACFKAFRRVCDERDEAVARAAKKSVA